MVVSVGGSVEMCLETTSATLAAAEIAVPTAVAVPAVEGLIAARITLEAFAVLRSGAKALKAENSSGAVVKPWRTEGRRGETDKCGKADLSLIIR